MNPATLSSYDSFPYSNHSFRETHPARLRAAGILLALDAPAMQDCRVLELGCGSGGNLAPMAYALPAARFVGIDLSERQIAEARGFASDVGLANVDFRHMSILDLTPDFGQFDYIICHGVFSWVPVQVQDKILEICRDNLSPAGVAFISFNAYPGSYARRAAREMMLFRTTGLEDESDRVRAAKEILKTMARLTPAMQAQWELVREKEDTYILHEYLEETNEPLYLHQFMARAGERQLQYLADALVNSSCAEEADEQSRRLLALAGDDIVRREQYLDFIRNQSFRRTLLCHASAGLDRASAVGRVPLFRVASPLRDDDSAREGEAPAEPRTTDNPRLGRSLALPASVRFTHPSGGFIQTDVPLVKAALWQLQSAFPRSIAFEELCRMAQPAAKVRDADMPLQRQQLAEELFGGWQADLIELRADPDPFTTAIAHKPQVSAVARRQAQLGAPVTTLRHEMVALDADYRDLIQWIDGTRGEEALARKLAEEGFPAEIRRILEQLSRQALLTSGR